MKKSRDSVFFPILINVQNFPCLVIGGGTIAGHKVTSLLKFNADVTVISPKVSKSIDDLLKKGKIKLIKQVYSKKFLSNFKFVFCATNNPQVDKIVHNDCKQIGILINVADCPSLCDFILPANIVRGDLTVSVSSQGKAPFYTKEMKRKLEEYISPIYRDIINLAGDLRKQLLIKLPKSDDKSREINNAKTKAEVFKKFCSFNWEKTLTKDKKNSKYYVQKILKDFNLS